jgi:hypothetical protein
VRGRERLIVSLVLLASATATGALSGVPALLLPDLPVVPFLVAAVLLDLLRVPTPSVRRQVPQAWTRLFSLRTAGFLYGARLGVGPLTILNTWLWWPAVLLGGPAAGAAFGAGRVVVMLLVGRWAEAAMPERMALLRQPRSMRPSSVRARAARGPSGSTRRTPMGGSPTA